MSPGHTIMHSIPSLTLVHLRLIARQSGLGAAVLAAAALLIPLWLLVADLRAVPAGNELSGLPGDWWPALLLTGGFVWLSYLLAFLWPETVWRNLGPGERSELDSLPVTRTRNRCARLLAGSSLPALLGLSVSLSAIVLLSRGAGEILEVLGAPDAGVDVGPNHTVISGPLAMLVAYSFSSILALRLGRVLLPLIVIALAVLALPALLVWGGAEWLRGFTEAVAFHPYSPIPALMYGGESVVPRLLWLVTFGAVAVHLAGKHDHQ